MYPYRHVSQGLVCLPVGNKTEKAVTDILANYRYSGEARMSAYS